MDKNTRIRNFGIDVRPRPRDSYSTRQLMEFLNNPYIICYPYTITHDIKQHGAKLPNWPYLGGGDHLFLFHLLKIDALKQKITSKCCKYHDDI